MRGFFLIYQLKLTKTHLIIIASIIIALLHFVSSPYRVVSHIYNFKLGEISEKDDPLECPDILLMVSEEVLVFDNLSGKLYLIVHAHFDTDRKNHLLEEWLYH